MLYEQLDDEMLMFEMATLMGRLRQDYRPDEAELVGEAIKRIHRFQQMQQKIDDRMRELETLRNHRRNYAMIYDAEDGE